MWFFFLFNDNIFFFFYNFIYHSSLSLSPLPKLFFLYLNTHTPSFIFFYRHIQDNKVVTQWLSTKSNTNATIFRSDREYFCVVGPPSNCIIWFMASERRSRVRMRCASRRLSVSRRASAQLASLKSGIARFFFFFFKRRIAHTHK